MWTLQESGCQRKLLVPHKDTKTSILTRGTKNVTELQFINYAKAPLVVISLPELIVVFKSEDGNTGVIRTSTVETDQSVTFIVYRSHCHSIGWSTRRPS